MSGLAALRAATGRLVALCLVTAAGEAALKDDDGLTGFRGACRLAILLALLRLLDSLRQSLG